MKEDLKIFFKYIFNVKEFFQIVKDGIQNLLAVKSLSTLFMLVSAVLFILMNVGKVSSTKINWFFVILFFGLFLYLKYLIVYRGGEHRRWYRDKKGIPSKKQSIREEFDLRENKNDSQNSLKGDNLDKGSSSDGPTNVNDDKTKKEEVTSQ